MLHNKIKLFFLYNLFQGQILPLHFCFCLYTGKYFLRVNHKLNCINKIIKYISNRYQTG